MDESLILDALFAAIGLLFIPIGLRRGATREVFTTAGVLTGAALGAAWATSWGADLADLAGLRVSHARFLVTVGFLAATTTVIGYWAPAAAQLGRPTTSGRIAGAVAAVMNGVLLLSFVLAAIERDLASASTQRSLTESVVANALLREFPSILLGFGGVALLMTMVGMILAKRSARMTIRSTAHAGGPAVTPGRRRRLRGGKDDGKVEPADRAFDPISQRYASDSPHHAQTMPIAPVPREAWGTDRPAFGAVSTAAQGEWVEVARHPGWPAPGQPRCPGCGEHLASHDVFCPRCGLRR